MTNASPLYKFITHTILRKTIHDGLLLALPLVIIGAISLTITSIPIPIYQEYLHTIANGKVYTTFHLIFTYAFSTLPLIFLFTMSFSFGRTVTNDLSEMLYYPIITFCSFLIFVDSPDIKVVDIFANTQTFTAVVITLTTCISLYLLRKIPCTDLQFYLKNPTSVFLSIYKMLLPCLIILIFFSFLNLVFDKTLKDTFINWHLNLFQYLEINFFSTTLYIVMEHIYWFFGIHGSNTLDAVTYTMLTPRTEANIAAAAAGLIPTEIYTHTFLYAFVWMGGSGTVICLLFATLLFAKNNHMTRTAKMSLLPCMFNISEIIIIGIPIICNPIFFIPFLLVPLTCVLTTSLAMQLGLVPLPSYAISWTTPIFISGYIITGSFAGTLLQIFNVFIGIYIYKPFVKLYEQAEAINFKHKFDDLVSEVINCERDGRLPSFYNNNELSETARNLTFDLRQAILHKQLNLYYQPQVSYDGTIYGGEALLRWSHPQVGFVYPPLIIFLAKEGDFLDELGLSLIESSFQDLQRMNSELDEPIKISVNVAPPQLHNQDFCTKVNTLLQKYNLKNSIIAFEITEQIALSNNEEIMDRLHELKSMGILLSMDDFGMGHSSVLYLQDSEFDIVKLDGSLTRKFLVSERSVDIISAITQLSEKFKFKVVAEYVETVEQREKLAALGCYIYQGWLYSPAIPLPDFIRYIKNHKIVS